MTMTVEKLKSFSRKYEFCEHRCIENLGDGSHGMRGGIKSATYMLTICGRDFYLCPKCAKEQAQVWEDCGGSVKRTTRKSRVVKKALVWDSEEEEAA